jgi:NAD(P)-dependent dehydrogenase (short-subunit alcohol dehydrogenase family)
MNLSELFSLKGKVALVTGGGRGLGKFIATGLAEAGADLILASRKIKNLEDTARELENNYKVRAFAITCDLTKEETIDTMLAETKKKFKRIDILVNNAGVTWGAPTLEYPQEKWDQLFDVNVRGLWIITQKVARIMKNQGGGNIINISSIMSFRGFPDELQPTIPYNPTKAAVNSLTMNLATKLAPYNIRVNAIAPGFFRTNMTAYLEKPEFKEQYETTLSSISLGRFGEINDIKGVAVFLASAASSYMTGHVLVNDGGLLAR